MKKWSHVAASPCAIIAGAKYAMHVLSMLEFEYQISSCFWTILRQFCWVRALQLSREKKWLHHQALCLKGSGLWNSASKSCNWCKYFLPSRSKGVYAEIPGSSVQGYSYLSPPASPTVSLVSKAFWIRFSALMYGNPSSPPNAILPRVFLSEPWPLKTKHSEITEGLF